MAQLPTALLCCSLLLAAPLPAQDGPPRRPVQIFILAGQSNMEGKGSVEVMRHQLSVPEKRERFARFERDGNWIEREDVWISYLGADGVRQGALTVGYGQSRAGSQEVFGPELGFGWTVGDALEADVLIIKTAWGGKSLDRDFRPPSRGLPDSWEAQFERAQQRIEALTADEYRAAYGHYYRLMIDEVRRVTGDLSACLPHYRDQGYQLAGFVWFQGWNDQYAPTSVQDYADNLAGLIVDVRSDLDAPALPFVIGAMGHGGANQSGKIQQIAAAQVAVAERPEWAGIVRTVRTAPYWDTEAEQAYDRFWKDEARRDVVRWREFGNDHAYHYFGSPAFFADAGTAFGEAMLNLIER